MIFIIDFLLYPAPIDIDAIQLLKETTDENGGALAFFGHFQVGLNSVCYLRLGNYALHHCFHNHADPRSRHPSC